MRTRFFSKGDLVKNTRSGEVGVVVKEDSICENQNSDGTMYYRVLSKDGTVMSWFKNHIVSVGVEDDGDDTVIRERLPG